MSTANSSVSSESDGNESRNDEFGVFPYQFEPVWNDEEEHIVADGIEHAENRVGNTEW